MAINEQTPCHDEKPNKSGTFVTKAVRQPSAIDAAAAEFSDLAGGIIRICSHALRVLREKPPARFKKP
jgi:hypothetical protein